LLFSSQTPLQLLRRYNFFSDFSGSLDLRPI
jgi:hypothetical protein